MWNFKEVIRINGRNGFRTSHVINFPQVFVSKDKNTMKKTMNYIITSYDISNDKCYEGMVESIHLGIYKDSKMKKVGVVSFMKKEDRKFFTEEGHHLIGKVVEVGGDKILPSGAMRHPYFIKMRPDLTRHDASLIEGFKLTPNQEIAADKAVERAEEMLARGEKEGFSQELFKELATQCLIGQVSYPVSETKHRWKNFNTQQAEDALNKIKSTNPVFKEIPREWIQMLLKRFKEEMGKGIKYAEKNIKKMKSSATKLPNKPLKLEDYLKNWAVGDEQFYEPQYGDGRISKDTFDKMPRKAKKKKRLVKKILESWSTGTDRLYGDNRLSDPDNKTGSYEIDDTIQPPHKLKKKKGKKVKLPHQGIEYPPKFYVEGVKRKFVSTAPEPQSNISTGHNIWWYNNQSSNDLIKWGLAKPSWFNYKAAYKSIFYRTNINKNRQALSVWCSVLPVEEIIKIANTWDEWLVNLISSRFEKAGLLKLIEVMPPSALFHAGAIRSEGMFRPPVEVPENFPYKEALEILKQKDQKYYEKALVGWPKGAEETQTTIDMMKSKAQKLPEKKLKLEGWAAGSDRNSGKRYKSDEEDDMDEFEKLARDTYYDANAFIYSKRKKKRKKLKLENFVEELLSKGN